MTYNPTNWKTGDVVTSAKLNNIEKGITNSVLVVDLDVENQRLDKTAREIVDAGIAVFKMQVFGETFASPRLGIFTEANEMIDGTHAGEIAMDFYFLPDSYVLTAYAKSLDDYPVPDLGGDGPAN